MLLRERLELVLQVAHRLRRTLDLTESALVDLVEHIVERLSHAVELRYAGTAGQVRGVGSEQRQLAIESRDRDAAVIGLRLGLRRLLTLEQEAQLRQVIVQVVRQLLVEG